MIVEAIRELVKCFRTIEQNTHLNTGGIVELARLPAIVLNGPSLAEKKRLARDAERLTAIDNDDLISAREVPPRWYDVRFDVNLAAGSVPELLGLLAGCARLPQSVPLLTAKTAERERRYSWGWITPPSYSGAPNISEVAEGRGALVIHDVEIYSGIREIVPLILSIEADINSGPATESVVLKE